MKPSILLSGITGFLGAALAERLSATHTVVGLVRKESNLWRLKEINSSNIIVLDMDSAGLETALLKYQPQTFIHAAWHGVAASDRDDWISQSHNVPFSIRLLALAKKIGITKYIGLGSQAEYGHFEGSIDESFACKPLAAYGAAKLATLDMVRSFCQVNNMQWIWLRLFPLFGIREDANWFIPMVIHHALLHKDLALTPGQQRYGYLSVTDFSIAIEKVISKKEDCSGIYNLSSDKSRTLRSVIDFIATATNTKAMFNFGALPYRPNQVMHMEGNAQKFFTTFNFAPNDHFEEDLATTIAYYKNKLNTDNEI